MDQRPPCRFFMQGNCRYGDSCAFSHLITPGPVPGRRVCTYFMQGGCHYGDDCQFEHPGVHRGGRYGGSHQRGRGRTGLNASAPVWTPRGYAHANGNRHTYVPEEDDDYASDEERFLAELEEQKFFEEQREFLEEAMPDEGIGGQASIPSIPSSELDAAIDALAEDLERTGVAVQKENPHGPPQENGPQAPSAEETAAERQEEPVEAAGSQQEAVEAGAEAEAPARSPRPDWPLCVNYFSNGSCPRGNACRFAHGLLCEVCGKHALHPDIPDDAEAHTRACKAREERLNKQPAAAELECSICLEKVLSKENAGERKFGLLSCEHPFCLACHPGLASPSRLCSCPGHCGTDVPSLPYTVLLRDPELSVAWESSREGDNPGELQGQAGVH
eukprot:jgi/Botrbrau1/7586/Bobra.0159s0035.1